MTYVLRFTAALLLLVVEPALAQIRLPGSIHAPTPPPFVPPPLVTTSPPPWTSTPSEIFKPLPTPPIAISPDVVPPPAPEAGFDPPDGSSDCDCYETENIPVMQDGEVVYQTTRRWTGRGPQCCPQQ